jgi:hypothetical protein
MAQPSRTGAASGPLLLADISGYTGFLQDVGTAHEHDAFANGQVPDAYALISTLLDGIIERLVPPFRLSKLEGDAVFLFADDTDDVPHGQALLASLDACYRGFRAQLGSAEQIWTCRCNACSRVDTLDLKFVLHAGGYFIQAIGGGLELVGPEVVMAHRLLKNGAAEQVGSRAYALMTDAVIGRLEVPTDGALARTETYEHYPPITVSLFPLPS